MKLCLIGAGGHGKVVAATIIAAGHEIVAYADMTNADWLDCPRIRDAEVDGLPKDVGIVVGIGGMRSDDLKRRRQIMQRHGASGRELPAMVDPRAILARDVEIGPGAQILSGAMVTASARIGAGAIVNTGAIVEHDAEIGAGAHVAPGAIVLGAAKVGVEAMVGAGAIILPSANVPYGVLVKAGTRWPR